MKFAYPGLVESRHPHSPPPASPILRHVYSAYTVLLGNSMFKALRRRIQAGLGRSSRPAISGGRDVFRGLLSRCGQHWQTMFGVSGIYCKIARPT